MAQPTPRSRSQILGEMLDSFLSEQGLPKLKVASPVLSVMEASAQSDLRSSNDIFDLLAAASLDDAEKDDLDRIGAAEGVPRLTEAPASGSVTVTDTSFAKVSTKVSQAAPAPIIGSLTLRIADGSALPATGSVYVGRGTTRFEGPLAYTAVLPPGSGAGQSGGSYYALSLSSPTLKFHNQGESVVLAQGGDRLVSPGTIVQTPQGNAVEASQYKTLYQASVPDGEVSVSGILVVALRAGVSGNTVAGGVSAFASAPFAGATVTNPTPITNGTATETDDPYRERIRAARQSRSLGTPLAIRTYSTGVVAPDEGRRVLSAQVVVHSGLPTSVYVDDGTGYEPTSAGVSGEAFYDQALGGERFAKVSSPRPIAKASVTSGSSAPFALASGMTWAFKVGGVTTSHSVSASEFRDVTSATAYEWVASVNADPSLGWEARTAGGGTQVVVSAKADSNEWVQYDPSAASSGGDVDGNVATDFGLSRVDTMRLYKNDRPLNKDGSLASVTSNPTSQWGALGPGSEDLVLQVDGAPLSNLVGGRYTFTAADFVAANTGYVTLGNNSPAAWAAVLNYRVPGVTATVVDGLVVLTSNLGASPRAQLSVVVGGSLTSKGVFPAQSSAGAPADYLLDRNSGELRLPAPLAVGDRLAAGTVDTRAFLETAPLGVHAVAAPGAHFWFAVDGAAALVPVGLTASTPVNVNVSPTTPVGAWGARERVAQASGTGMFAGVEVGDWAVFWDPASPADVLDHSFRVSAVAGDGSWVEFDRSSVVTASGLSLGSGGLVFARTQAQLQAVSYAADASATASSISDALDTSLVGAQATVYRTSAFRVSTSTFDETSGDVALVAADVEAQKILKPAGATDNVLSHLASVESAHSEVGTPDFRQVYVTSAAGVGVQPAVDWDADPVWAAPDAGALLAGLRPDSDGRGAGESRFGSIFGHASSLSSATLVSGHVYDLVLRDLPYETLKSDRWWLASAYQLAPQDQLAVVVDGDDELGRFVVPMGRTLATVGPTYASTNTFRDADNGGQSLAVGFGFGAGAHDFDDYAVFMAARAQTHLVGDTTHYPVSPADSTRTVLWRYYRRGPDGERCRLRYTYPAGPGAAVALSVDNYSSDHTDVSVVLGSGAAKSLPPLQAGGHVGVVVSTPPVGTVGNFSDVSFLLGMAVNLATTDTVTPSKDVTVQVNFSGAGSHGIPNGATVYVKFNNAAFIDGAYTVTATTATTLTVSNAAVAAGLPAVPTAVSGTLTYGPAEQTLAGASPTVAVGDYFRWSSGTGLPTDYRSTTMQLSAFSDPQTLRGFVGTSETTTGAGPVVWYPVSDAGGLTVFANAGQTASAISAAVNALGGVVSGTLVGTGSGVVTSSSVDQSYDGSVWFNLADGLNYVQSTTAPGSVSGDYQLSFKLPITASLATSSDWVHEVVELAPRTAKNVADWLNSLAVSGLSSLADVERSSAGRKVQVASLTPGSSGSVEVQGGDANSATAAVLGSAFTAGPYMVATVPAAEAAAVLARAWVSVDNAGVLPKSLFTGSTVLSSVTNSGTTSTSTLTITGTNFYTSHGDVAHAVVAVEQHGSFWQVRDTGFGGALDLSAVVEGDLVRLSAPATPTYVGAAGYELVEALSGGNQNLFRVVRVLSPADDGHQALWVENPSGVAQALTEAHVQVVTPDSAAPGDVLKVSTSLWDGAASNQGSWVVASVGDAGSGPYSSPGTLTVNGTMSPFSSHTTALGSSSQQVQLVEGSPTRLVKQVLSVAPNPTDPTLADVKLTASALFGRVGSVAGSVLTVLDKLGFPTGQRQGVDAYRYSTGFVAAVTKVLYGDPDDEATYPGVVAAGGAVDVLGPLVRRIQVTLAVRARTGAATEDVRSRIKSAVAAVVNQTATGQSIALSDLVSAAAKVGGVVSAVMVSPLATAGSDMISVQPNEKPMVLDVDADVSVSFIGG